MGHRNMIGWRRDGKVVGSYSQWGGYHDGIPVTIQGELIEFAAKHGDNVWAELGALIDKMRLVNSQDVVPEAERAEYAASHDPAVSTGTDWYSYLRDHQGSLMKRLEAGVMTDDSEFIKDSLFCEYAVIVDTDDRRIVLLDGFNEDPDKEWPHAKVDVASWTPSYEGDKLEYYACSVHWSGTLEEFLALDIATLAPAEEDA